jgi:hypothetical protein
LRKALYGCAPLMRYSITPKVRSHRQKEMMIKV